MGKNKSSGLGNVQSANSTRPSPEEMAAQVAREANELYDHYLQRKVDAILRHQRTVHDDLARDLKKVIEIANRGFSRKKALGLLHEVMARIRKYKFSGEHAGVLLSLFKKARGAVRMSPEVCAVTVGVLQKLADRHARALLDPKKDMKSYREVDRHYHRSKVKKAATMSTQSSLPIPPGARGRSIVEP